MLTMNEMHTPCLTLSEQGSALLKKLNILPVHYRVRTHRSLDEFIQYLHTMKTRWEVRRWDADWSHMYLLACENLSEVSACLAAHGILAEIQFEQDLAACIAMAAFHGVAYCQIVEMMGGGGARNQIQEYEVRIQGIEVLASLLGRKQGRLYLHEETYWAYCRGFERCYLDVFVHAFYSASMAFREREQERAQLMQKTAFDAFPSLLERDERCAI